MLWPFAAASLRLIDQIPRHLIAACNAVQSARGTVWSLAWNVNGLHGALAVLHTPPPPAHAGGSRLLTPPAKVLESGCPNLIAEAKRLNAINRNCQGQLQLTAQDLQRADQRIQAADQEYATQCGS